MSESERNHRIASAAVAAVRKAEEIKDRRLVELEATIAQLSDEVAMGRDVITAVSTDAGKRVTQMRATIARLEAVLCAGRCPNEAPSLGCVCDRCDALRAIAQPRDADKLSAMLDKVPPERRAMSGVRRALAADTANCPPPATKEDNDE